jgi:hypothetical protein
MSDISERPLDDTERVEFEIFGEKGLALLCQQASSDPHVLVDAVDACTYSHQKRNRFFLSRVFRRKTTNIEKALGLGIVWGNQLVRRFGWEWVCLVINGVDRYAVVSPDRSLAVYPTYFIKACLDNPYADCTAMLAFNMMDENNVPDQTPGTYLNMMEGVFRIIPRG